MDSEVTDANMGIENPSRSKTGGTMFSQAGFATVLNTTHIVIAYHVYVRDYSVLNCQHKFYFLHQCLVLTFPVIPDYICYYISCL